MRNPVEELESELRKDGVAAIERIIDRKLQEQFFVDFKRTKIADYTGKTRLEDSDRCNFSRAISGFGNSEGGVIIWGIEGKDFATGKMLIKGFETFQALLNSYVSKSTVPAHDLVENFAIPDGNEQGFVVTVIPKSQRTPHMSIDGANEGRYFMRAGDSFLPIPHSVLAGMFGRRPSPDVKHVHYIIDTNHYITPDEYVRIDFTVVLGNFGMGIGRDVYVNSKIEKCPEGIRVITKTPDSRFEGTSMFNGLATDLSSSRLILAPEQRVQPLMFEIEMKPPFENGFCLSLMCGSEGQMPDKWELSWTSDDLERFYKVATLHPDTKELAQDMLFEKNS